MDKLITEDVLKQIRLINYERSKTLSEQSVAGAPNQGMIRYRTDAEIQANMDAEELKKKINQNCNSILNGAPVNENEKTAKKIFLILKNQIDSWGTKKQIILDALKLIDSKKTYMSLLVYIYACYPEESQGKTVLQFIQSQEFSLGSWGSEFKRNSAIGFGQELQWQDNDSWLEVYQKILQKFNPDEKYDVEVPEFDSDWMTTITQEVLPPYARELSHIAIPILSVLTSFIGVGVSVSAWLVRSGIVFGVESVDAAIYKFGDKNDYAAGLALMFAIAGPLDAGLELLVTKYGASLLKKLTLKEVVLSKGEIELAADVVVNGSKYEKLTKLGMAKEFTKQILTKASNSNVIVKFVLKLMKKGLLLTNLTARIGVLIGGTFYTWDAIAKHMGICNTMPLKQLQDTDWKILQAAGVVGEYIQPFTISCEVEAMMKKINAMRTDNDLFIDLLEKAKKENETYSTTYGYYNINVLIAQYVFYAAGLDDDLVKSNYILKNNILTINNSEIIKNVSMYTSLGKLIKTINNNNNSKVLTYDFGNLKSVVIMKFTMFDNTIETGKLFVGAGLSVTYTFNILGKPEWGIFDKPTEKLVTLYQKQNKLSVDGKIGPETLSKLISDLKTKKYGEIKNIKNENFDNIRIAEVTEEYNEYLKQKDKLILDEKSVADALEQNKNNKESLIKDITNNLKDADKLTDEQFEEIFGKYNLPN